MKKTVMVVDDSLFAYEEMRRILNETDFEIVCHCKSGEEAVARYSEVKPDIVTMDIILPGIDGFEATEGLIKSDPDAIVVMVSSLAYDDTMQKADQIGAKGFIFKPFDGKYMLKALAKATQKEPE